MSSGPHAGRVPERAKPLATKAAVFSASGGGSTQGLGLLLSAPFCPPSSPEVQAPKLAEFTGALNYDSSFPGQRI